MTDDEVREFMRANPGVFYRVYATAKPEFSEVIEYRFPGISHTGYFVESESHIFAFSDWLNIEKMESWQ